jgi:hypothetical protein
LAWAEVVTTGQGIEREDAGIAGMSLGLAHETALKLRRLRSQCKLGFERKGAATADQEQICEAQALRPARAIAVE